MHEHATTQTEHAHGEASDAPEAEVSGWSGAAGFADAETREILSLLGGQGSGACCGGSCCSA